MTKVEGRLNKVEETQRKQQVNHGILDAKVQDQQSSLGFVQSKCATLEKTLNSCLATSKAAQSSCDKMKDTLDPNRIVGRDHFRRFATLNKAALDKLNDQQTDQGERVSILEKRLENPIEVNKQDLKKHVAEFIDERLDDFKAANQTEEFQQKKTTVWQYYPLYDDETDGVLQHEAQNFVINILNLPHVDVVRARRFQGPVGDGVVKVELATEEQKKDVMRERSKIKDAMGAYSRIFIRESHSAEERKAQANLRTLVKELQLPLDVNEKGYLVEAQHIPRSPGSTANRNNRNSMEHLGNYKRHSSQDRGVRYDRDNQNAMRDGGPVWHAGGRWVRRGRSPRRQDVRDDRWHYTRDQPPSRSPRSRTNRWRQPRHPEQYQSRRPEQGRYYNRFGALREDANHRPSGRSGSGEKLTARSPPLAGRRQGKSVTDGKGDTTKKGGEEYQTYAEVAGEMDEFLR